jgi:hypothetical protein
VVLFSFLFLKSQICTTPVFSFPWVLASFISGQIHRSFLAWNGCPNFPSKNQVIHVISHLMLILQAWFKVWSVPEMHSVCLNNPFKGDLCTTICLILINLVNSSCAWLPMCYITRLKENARTIPCIYLFKKSSIISPTHTLLRNGLSRWDWTST